MLGGAAGMQGRRWERCVVDVMEVWDTQVRHLQVPEFFFRRDTGGNFFEGYFIP